MRFIFGCSSVVGLVVFLIGFAISLFIAGLTLTERLMLAAMHAGIIFLALLLLGTRDLNRKTSAFRKTRSDLLARNDSTDEQFLAAAPYEEDRLLLETRKAISRFFEVPEVKVGREVHLIKALRVDRLEPDFQFYVVDSVITSQSIKPRPFSFTMKGLTSIDDLTLAIRKVLDDQNRSEFDSLST